jgi:hypothetical protein
VETEKERLARYAKKPRIQKLGVTAAARVSVLGVDDETFLKELASARAAVFVGRAAKNSDLIFYGVTKESQLPRLARLKLSITSNGAIWVIRPKGRPEISEASVMAGGKLAGLVDVKVVSFSPTHTAEKFVIPVAERS